MLLQLAWRNVLRARRRTIITLILSTVSTAFFILYTSLMDGSYAKIFRDSVEIYPGYIQITHKDYRDDPGYEHLIFDTRQVQEAVATTSGIADFTIRFEGFGLFAGSENSVGGMLAGIDPEEEKRFSRIFRAMQSGRYLEATDRNAVIMGSDLAKRLGVTVGDTVSIITNATDYSFAADNLQVVGLFQTHLHDFDVASAFVSKSYFDRLMQSRGMATQVIVLPDDPADSKSVAAALSLALSGTDYIAEEWHVYLSGIIEAMEFDRISGETTMWLFLIIIFFVVMIYALLTIFSRTKEIGIMRAIGTTPGQVAAILLLETLILGLASTGLGAVIGGSAAYYFELNPIYLPQFEEAYRDFGIIEAVLPADFTWTGVLRGVAYMLGMNLLCALYPIIRVNRYTPVEAISHV